MNSGKIKVKIEKRIVETPDVVSIYFKLPFDYESGQYITVYFDETGVGQGRAYSLSSCLGDDLASITVKKIGLFSGKIHELKVGDELTIGPAYGFLNDDDGEPIVAIAGGVGIAPIWSIMRDTLNKDKDRKILLLDSNRTADDIVFHEKINQLSKKWPNFNVKYFVTRQASDDIKNRRIDLSKDLPNESMNARFYVCGSVDFVSGIWKQLKELQIPDEKISTESFFGRN